MNLWLNRELNQGSWIDWINKAQSDRYDLISARKVLSSVRIDEGMI